jgi:PAS domain S-box-containing protein
MPKKWVALVISGVLFFSTVGGVEASEFMDSLDRHAKQNLAALGVVILVLQAGWIALLVFNTRQRKKAEQALRHEQVLTRALFDSVPGMLYLYTAEGRLLRWNKKHEELTGYSSEELSRMTVQDWFYESDLVHIREQWEKVFIQGKVMTEFFLKHKDGARVPYLATGVHMSIEGQPYLLGVAIDITEHKNLQEESKRKLLELAHVSRAAMMGEFSASLAHELNQPLGAILRHAEAAEILLEGANPDITEIRSIFLAIRNDNQRAASVIQRLRELLERRIVQTEPVDISTLVDDTLAIVRHEFIKRRIETKKAVPPQMPLVIAERVHLQQVLLNLLTNAMDAVQELDVPRRNVSISAHRNDAGMLQVTVEDSGTGIPADELVKIFDSFYTTKPSGLGMGLSISRTIVEAHGGRIRASSTPGKGTTISFTLPVVEAT